MLLDKEETINENGDTDSEPQHEEEFIVLTGTCCEPSYLNTDFDHSEITKYGVQALTRFNSIPSIELTSVCSPTRYLVSSLGSFA